MIKKNLPNNICRLIFILLLISVPLIREAAGQKIDCVQYVAPDQISVQLTKNFDSLTQSRPDQFVIVRERDTGVAINLSNSTFTGVGNNTFAFKIPAPLVSTNVYTLYIKNMTFGGKPPQVPLQALINPTGRCGAPPPGAAPQGRDDSSIYAAGQLEKASGTKIYASIDTKLRRRIYQTDTTSTTLPKVIHDVGFVFDLKASTSPKADPDSMNIGLEWQMSSAATTGFFRYFILYNNPKIEAEKDFDNTNALLETRLDFGTRNLAKKPWTPIFTPFIGQEIGKNLKSPVKEAENSFLYRLKAGTKLNLFFQPKKFLKEVELDAEYTRRWLLRRELSFEKDGDGNLRLLEISKKPRDYVRANLNFFFTENIGVTVGYEYGSLPPSFKLVDHKSNIGVIFKFK